MTARATSPRNCCGTGCTIPTIEIVSQHQLLPEMMEPISRAAHVIFIDATVSGRAGKFHGFRCARPRRAPASPTTPLPSLCWPVRSRSTGTRPRRYCYTIPWQVLRDGPGIDALVRRAVNELVDSAGEGVERGGFEFTAETHKSQRKTQRRRNSVARLLGGAAEAGLTVSTAGRWLPALGSPHKARCVRSRRGRTWRAPPPSAAWCRRPVRGSPGARASAITHSSSAAPHARGLETAGARTGAWLRARCCIEAAQRDAAGRLAIHQRPSPALRRGGA